MPLKIIYDMSPSMFHSMESMSKLDIPSELAALIKVWVGCCIEEQQFYKIEALVDGLNEINNEIATAAMKLHEKPKLIGLSKSQLSTNIKQLIDLGVIIESREMHDGKSYKIRRLHTLKPFALRPPQTIKNKGGRPSSRSREIGLELISEHANAVSIEHDTTPVIIKLMSFLAKCLPVSLGEEETGWFDFKMDGLDFKVAATCKKPPEDELDNKEDREAICLMTPRDFGVISTIQGELRKAMEGKDYNSHHEGSLGFDLAGLSKFFNASNPVDEVRKAIQRIRYTVFTIKQISRPEAGAPFQVYEGDFRFFAEFEQLSSLIKDDKLLGGEIEKIQNSTFNRFYKVKCHSRVVDDIKNFGDRSFISHPALRSEKNNYLHMIYLWCKRVIGTSAAKDRPSNDPARFTYHCLRGQIHPAKQHSNFQSSHLTALKKMNENKEIDTKQLVDTPVVVNVLGYFHKIYVDEELYYDICRRRHKSLKKKATDKIIIEVWRDPNDPYVGDDSASARAAKYEESKYLEETSDLNFDYNNMLPRQDDLLGF